VRISRTGLSCLVLSASPRLICLRVEEAVRPLFIGHTHPGRKAHSIPSQAHGAQIR
jgi:hypothetical protein